MDEKRMKSITSVLIGLLFAGTLAGCGAAGEDEMIPEGDLASATQAITAGGVYMIVGPLASVVVPPGGSTANVQLISLLDGSGAGAAAGSINPNYYRWRFNVVGGHYQIVNYATGKCMNVEGASMANSARVIQYPCGPASQTNALWDVVTIGGGLGGHLLQNRHSGKCLNIAGGDEGTWMIQYTCGNVLNEDFILHF